MRDTESARLPEGESRALTLKQKKRVEKKCEVEGRETLLHARETSGVMYYTTNHTENKLKPFLTITFRTFLKT